MNGTPEIGPERAEQLLAPVALLADQPGPIPVIAGTFALYEDGKGGFVLVTNVDGKEDRKHIPAALVKMATGGGVMGGSFRKLMGG